MMPVDVSAERAVLSAAYAGIPMPPELTREHVTSCDRRVVHDIVRALERAGAAVDSDAIRRCARAMRCAEQCQAELWRCEYTPVCLPLAPLVGRLIELAQRRELLGRLARVDLLVRRPDLGDMTDVRRELSALVQAAA